MITAFFRALSSLFYRPDLLQVGALCLRGDSSDTEVLLIRSLDSNRWIIPKGWPMRGKTLAEAAAIEAWEEAGVRGKISKEAIGSFSYAKRRGSGVQQDCLVQVYVMRVSHVEDDFPEAHLRKSKWFSVSEAIERVREPDLQSLLQRYILDPC